METKQMMTRKDYEIVATGINAARKKLANERGAGTILFIAADDMARGLQEQNPRFDRVTFLKACGFTVRDNGAYETVTEIKFDAAKVNAGFAKLGEQGAAMMQKKTR